MRNNFLTRKLGSDLSSLSNSGKIKPEDLKILKSSVKKIELGLKRNKKYLVRKGVIDFCQVFLDKRE